MVRRAISILESPKVYEEVFGPCHPVVFHRDHLLEVGMFGC
jgi:hypothetical protein